MFKNDRSYIKPYLSHFGFNSVFFNKLGYFGLPVPGNDKKTVSASFTEDGLLKIEFLDLEGNEVEKVLTISDGHEVEKLVVENGVLQIWTKKKEAKENKLEIL